MSLSALPLVLALPLCTTASNQLRRVSATRLCLLQAMILPCSSCSFVITSEISVILPIALLDEVPEPEDRPLIADNGANRSINPHSHRHVFCVLDLSLIPIRLQSQWSD